MHFRRHRRNRAKTELNELDSQPVMENVQMPTPAEDGPVSTPGAVMAHARSGSGNSSEHSVGRSARRYTTFDRPECHQLKRDYPVDQDLESRDDGAYDGAYDGEGTLERGRIILDGPTPEEQHLRTRFNNLKVEYFKLYDKYRGSKRGIAVIEHELEGRKQLCKELLADRNYLQRENQRLATSSKEYQHQISELKGKAKAQSYINNEEPAANEFHPMAPRPHVPGHMDFSDPFLAVGNSVLDSPVDSPVDTPSEPSASRLPAHGLSRFCNGTTTLGSTNRGSNHSSGRLLASSGDHPVLGALDSNSLPAGAFPGIKH